MILKGYLFSFLYVAVCILIAIIAFKLGCPKKYTRKIVHILVGFEWLILYFFLGTSIHSIIICAVFTALLLLSYLKKLLPMMSSDEENDPGTVYYGIAMTVMAVVSYFVPEFMYCFGIAVFCTSIGDGFAGVFGAVAKKYNVKIYKNKTLIGTLAGLLFSLASTLTVCRVFSLQMSLLSAFCIAVFSAGIEVVSGYGLDNITISLGTSLISFMLLHNASAILPYIIPIIFTPFVIAVVLSKRVLTPKGVILALAMDAGVTFAFGNFGFVYLLSFLFFSVANDKLKKHLKKKKDDITKKTDRRDEIQVLANGLIPVLSALLFAFTKHEAFIVAYVAGLAEAFSDTCASGFGMLSNSAYDVFRRKKVEVGLSGGMSLLGTMASLVSAFAFPLIAVGFKAIDFKLLLIAGSAAFIGNILDSLLGSLVQAKYNCSVCGTMTEKEEHCGEKTSLCRGFKLITNDVVNFISTISATLISLMLYYILV